ncbi:MAG: FtsX-like permease family protein [Candidatus Cloacimonetes bacterium]|nr:FtsX-like permease family protein [Candidatus Cloacimonadota bacterium]
MLKFLIKGLFRDRSRSLIPILVVSAGVTLTVCMISFMQGYLRDMIYENARFATGHVKIVTRSFSDMIDQRPLDLALLGVSDILDKWETQPQSAELLWVPRISFGGLLDIPDENGETRFQGEVGGMAVVMRPHSDSRFDPDIERRLLKLDDSIVRGRMPATPGEMLVSEQMFTQLDIPLGHTASIIGSTMFGSMVVHNFTIVGTIEFGIEALDRGGVIIDFADAQSMLDMEDGAGEILGFFPDFEYYPDRADGLKESFNAILTDESDEFSPLMLTEYDQNQLGAFIQYSGYTLGITMFAFVFVMVIVLWNAGLMQGIRRYGEIGVRLAMGESKGHVFRAMIIESLAIGCVGSVIGTAVGLALSYWMQAYGFDMSHYMTNSSMMMSNVMRAHVNLRSYLVGFAPGIGATVLGAAMAGAGIFKRQTSQLFKELET